MNTLTAVFEHHIISHISWPVLLPDLSVCVLFSWGYLIIKVFLRCSADLHNLKQRISDEINQCYPTGLVTSLSGNFFLTGCVSASILMDYMWWAFLLISYSLFP